MDFKNCTESEKFDERGEPYCLHGTCFLAKSMDKLDYFKECKCDPEYTGNRCSIHDIHIPNLASASMIALCILFVLTIIVMICYYVYRKRKTENKKDRRVQRGYKETPKNDV